MRRLSAPVAAFGAAAVLLLAGGAFALATSRGSTITVCVSHNGGALYRAKQCAARDQRLSWSRLGRRGPRGTRGSQGVKGDQGPAGPLTTTLPSGQTLRGWFNFDTVAGVANQIVGGSFSFSLNLASAPTVQIVPVGGPTTTQCAGSLASPTAAPGYLCVYESSQSNVSIFAICASAACGVTPTADPFGAETFVHATNSGRFYVDGTWAVTAP
jgi:hypothetical protein